MYTDNTLTPKEVLRLAALGSLAIDEAAYSALASAVRHFVSRIIGPTPEVLSHSLELLKVEGLVETVSGEGDKAVLRLTADGRAELRVLLTARVRGTSTSLDRLVVALKFRYLHLLDPADQCMQTDLLVDVCERELTGLTDLREHHTGEPGYLPAWLDAEIARLDARLAWLTAFRNKLYDSTAPSPLR